MPAKSEKTTKTYVVRVVYKDENVELHEFKNKKKALFARDNFRALEAVQSAKMRLDESR